MASCGPCGLALPSWSLPIAPENATFPTPQAGAYRPHPTSPSLLFLICTMGTAGLASQWDCEVLGRGQKTINAAGMQGLPTPHQGLVSWGLWTPAIEGKITGCSTVFLPMIHIMYKMTNSVTKCSSQHDTHRARVQCGFTVAIIKLF